MIILALEKLYTDVVSFFAANNITCTQTFGWREPARQHVAEQRIAWVPGSPGGELGTYTSARYPGQAERSLGTLNEVFHCVISTHADPAAVEDELLAWKRTRILYQQWAQAVYRSAFGTYQILNESWDISRKERRYGTAIIAVASIESKIPDTQLLNAYDLAGPLRAVVDVELGDTTEQFETAAAPYAVTAVTSANIVLSGDQGVGGDGSQVLVKDQTNLAENGLYIVDFGGAWARDSSVTLVNDFFVSFPPDASYKLVTANPIEVGTTPLVWETVSS